ncbi:hypothetical protein K6V72_00150 [Ralstonia insidiosa]|uniref:Uncharacterized protein n=2 Tax=Ralstonia insidiosa TaxID=190721 RepID=A0A192A2F4_9RALS|nr:hypothetical protein A9Y76_08085 [Ralstonia insidiosa]KAB0472973.1 hypothetical protein F7R11_10630 [Ralstonia insidiosa]MBY4907392.1 hypothetical protein [Ralstonia insidiosa]
MPDVPIKVPDLARQRPLFIVRHFAPACYLYATLAMGCAMRNINLWTILICLAGGLYVYEYYPRNGAKIEIAIPAVTHQEPAVAPAPEPPKPAPVVNTQPTYTPPPPAPAQPQQSGSIDPWTAELARQADARIARQRGEWAAQDRQAAQVQAAQANAAAATCIGLRQEKEGILASQRHGGTAQWMNYLNDRFHTVSDALYRNRC